MPLRLPPIDHRAPKLGTDMVNVGTKTSNLFVIDTTLRPTATRCETNPRLPGRQQVRQHVVPLHFHTAHGQMNACTAPLARIPRSAILAAPSPACDPAESAHQMP